MNREADLMELRKCEGGEGLSCGLSSLGSSSKVSWHQLMVSLPRLFYIGTFVLYCMYALYIGQIVNTTSICWILYM